MSKRNLLVALGLAAGLTLAGTATANAHTVGDPTPAPTFKHVPQPRSALWQFDFTGANIDGLSLNDVRGIGAIPMSRWTETDLSPVVSKFSRGINSVTLRHNRLPLPVINLNTCTATFDQLGNFRIIAGTGTGAGFRVVPGTDEYLLRGIVSLDFINKHGHLGDRRHLRQVCPLQFVTPFLVRQALENNAPIAGQLPQLVDFDVQGNAQLVRVRPLPVPYPSHFTPTVNPNPDETPSE